MYASDVAGGLPLENEKALALTLLTDTINVRYGTR